MFDILGAVFEGGLVDREGLSNDITAVNFEVLAEFERGVANKKSFLSGNSGAVLNSLSVLVTHEAEGADFSDEDEDKEGEGPTSFHVEGRGDARNGSEKSKHSEVMETTSAFPFESVRVVRMVSMLVMMHSSDFRVSVVPFSIHMNRGDEGESAVDEEQDGTDESTLTPGVSTLLDF